MNAYGLLKFLHVASVVIWLGGSLMLSYLILRVTKVGDRPTLASLLRHAGLYGRAVVAPASLLTLLTGIGMLATLGIPPDELWVRWGFVGIFGHFVLGATLMRKATRRLQELAAGDGPDAALQSARRRYGVLNAAYLVLLLSVVAAMALKPSF
jgi:putative membrane protein